MFTTEGEQYACGVGCSKPSSAPIGKDNNDIFLTVAAIKTETNYEISFQKIKEAFWQLIRWGEKNDQSSSDNVSLNMTNVIKSV